MTMTNTALLGLLGPSVQGPKKIGKSVYKFATIYIIYIYLQLLQLVKETSTVGWVYKPV